MRRRTRRARSPRRRTRCWSRHRRDGRSRRAHAARRRAGGEPPVTAARDAAGRTRGATWRRRRTTGSSRRSRSSDREGATDVAPRRRAPLRHRHAPAERPGGVRISPRPHAGSRHRVHRDAAAGDAGRRRRARRRPARAPRPAAALVRPARSPEPPWQLLKSDTRASSPKSPPACCWPTASAPRAGRCSTLRPRVADIAPTLPAAFVAPDTAAEPRAPRRSTASAPISTCRSASPLLKTDAPTIAGTRLRGIAEAAGFRLAEGGRFDWVQDETGAVLYSLQNYRSEPFTADTLRAASTPGAVFVLDVPRVRDPARASTR